jgi:hypothetical protein
VGAHNPFATQNTDDASLTLMIGSDNRIDSCDLLFHQLEDRRPEVSRDAPVTLRSCQPILQEDMAEASRA